VLKLPRPYNTKSRQPSFWTLSNCESMQYTHMSYIYIYIPISRCNSWFSDMTLPLGLDKIVYFRLRDSCVFNQMSLSLYCITLSDLVYTLWLTCTQRLIWLSNIFDYERTWWRLFHKHVVHTKLDIYVSAIITGSISPLMDYWQSWVSSAW